MIVSKDNDFRQRSFLEGAPPKIIWLNVGNTTTAAIVALLNAERDRMEAFETEEEASLLVLALLDDPHRSPDPK